jgi:hypothetical protein
MAASFLRNLNINGEVENFSITIRSDEGQYDISFNSWAQSSKRTLLASAESFTDKLVKFIKSRSGCFSKQLTSEIEPIPEETIQRVSTIHRELINLMINTDHSKKNEVKNILESFLRQRLENPQETADQNLISLSGSLEPPMYVGSLHLESTLPTLSNTSCELPLAIENSEVPLAIGSSEPREYYFFDDYVQLNSMDMFESPRNAASTNIEEHVIDLSNFIIDTSDGCRLKCIDKMKQS